MRDIGNGYGSKYHLLDFWDNRCKELDSLIKQQTCLTGDFQWKFPDVNKKAKEFKGIEFLTDETTKPKYYDIKEKWKNFWPQRGNTHNWDGVIKINNRYVLVEAKAHIGELKSKCGATSEKSLGEINNAFEKTIKKYGSSSTVESWKNKYYQLANRLAFIYFMNEELKPDFDALLLNIYFINGYENLNQNKSVESKEAWEKAVKTEYDWLGLNDSKALSYVHSVYIDCHLG